MILNDGKDGYENEWLNTNKLIDMVKELIKEKEEK